MVWLVLIALIAGIVSAKVWGAATLATATGTGLIYLGNFISGIASKFLDISLLAFVAQFNSFIYTGTMANAISTVWTAFRDLGNIVIIGALVFIAISMILGLQSFGTRKMVARVLLIAILINFSLLFTRIVFSGSNFIATQFYCAMAKNLNTASACNGSTTVNISSFLAEASANDGIGGQFLLRLGLNDVKNAEGVVAKIAEKPESGAVYALFYALAAMVMMIAAAIVFGYIAYLLIVRTLLFLFLAGTAALAFAAFLIPKGEGYWNMWWKALLQNSVLAPLLMILLWATFVFAKALVEGPGASRNFQELFLNPTAGSGYLALLIFFLVLAMLAASAYFARSFSKGIAGFNYASMLAATPLALGDRLTGLLGRRVLGGYNALAARRAGADQSEAQAKAATASNFFTKALYNRQLRRAGDAKDSYEARSKQTYELGQTKGGQSLLSALGAKKDIPLIGGYGGKVESAADRDKRIIDNAAKQGSAAADLSKAAKEMVRNSAAQNADFAGKTKELGQQLTKTQNAQKPDSAGALKTRDKHEDDLRDAMAKRTANEKDAADAERKGDKTTATKHRAAMKDQDERIKKATESLTEFKAEIDKAQKAVDEHLALGKEGYEKTVGDKAVEVATERIARQVARSAARKAAPVSNLLSTLSRTGLLDNSGSLANRAGAAAAKGLEPVEKENSRWQKLLKGVAKDFKPEK